MASPARISCFFGILALVALPGACAATEVKVEVATAAPATNTSQDYVCVTMDWWPPDKCDYGNCSWGSASAFNMDLTDPKLIHAMRALSPVTLRIGGTLADFVVYNVSNPAYCLPQVTTGTAKWDFRGGCLSTERWAAIQDFCAAAGCGLVFALSELYNRFTDDAPWDPSNARALLAHTRGMANASLVGVELGNEVGGPDGILAHLPAAQVAADFHGMRALLDDLWSDQPDRTPMLIGPDAMIDAEWVSAFLAALRPGTLDAFTYHLYLDAGSDPALMTNFLTPQFLYDKGQSRARKMVDVVRRYLPRTPLWMGEAGGAYNSGQNSTTTAFVSGFWYLDQLGGFAAVGHQTHCRQTFCGGNYGLIDVATHQPLPDYWNALLFTHLMSERVLNVTVPGYPAALTRVYAHCTRGGPAGSVTALVLNYDGENEVQVTVPFAPLPRTEFVLTSDDLRSAAIALNGAVLEPQQDGSIQVPAGRKVASGEPALTVPPHAYAFFVMPDAGVPACH